MDGADLGAAAVQNLAGAAVMAARWLALEAGGRARAIDPNPEFAAAFAWTVVANSVGATLLLLLWLLARGAAGRVTGLFFLVPPVTALAATPLLGKRPGWGLIAAILLGAAAVRLLAGEGQQAPAPTGRGQAPAPDPSRRGRPRT